MLMNGENGAFPPTRDGSIHPFLSRKSAWKRLNSGAYPFNNAEIAENARKKTEHIRSLSAVFHKKVWKKDPPYCRFIQKLYLCGCKRGFI